LDVSETTDGKKQPAGAQWYEEDIQVRGCDLSLPQIKSAYRELAILTDQHGEKLLAKEIKREGESDEQLAERRKAVKEGAFKVTVSVIGFDGQTTYGESEETFDSKALPLPIKTIFFTNTTAFKRFTNGVEPDDRFGVWLHFDKPPLFDPNPLVSHPTQNHSLAILRAFDLGYYRAVQTIIGRKLKGERTWRSIIHGKFVYDIGLWFGALPYALYWVTVVMDYLTPSGGSHASFRTAVFIYGLGLALLTYRALFGYLKWAFPVNSLEENKDRATWHRRMLVGIVTSLVVGGVIAVMKMMARI
jgi:hypothetical protein